MPRPRKTTADKRVEIFSRNYRMGKARTGFHEPDVARALGISESTLRRNKKSPGEKFSVEQLAILGNVFEWSDEDFLAIIRPEERK